jgi:membrane protein
VSAPVEHPEAAGAIEADLRDDEEKVVVDTDRVREVVTRTVEKAGGVPAVQKLLLVFEEYDHAGGGLSANGLAYSALFALVPGILLLVAVLGLVINNPTIEEEIVNGIAKTFPPLAPLVDIAFKQISDGAVPMTVFAVLGLLWGSSRFYSALDYAFSRLFRTVPRRNEIEKGVRGVLVSLVVVVLPLLLMFVGSFVTWLIDVTPRELDLPGLLRGPLSLGSPLSTWILFVGGLALVYKLVPNANVCRHAYGWPAILAGTVIAIFTQIFTFIAPRMLHWQALFGTLVSVFAVLIWLSISLNVILFGACWTRVRVQAIEEAADGPEGSALPGAAPDAE